MKTKKEFSKKLLIADYSVLILMIVVFVVFSILDRDTSNCSIVISAWIGQTAVASGFYYWKAKAENLIKLPILILQDIPEDMRERIDPNQIIESVIGIGTNN